MDLFDSCQIQILSTGMALIIVSVGSETERLFLCKSIGQLRRVPLVGRLRFHRYLPTSPHLSYPFAIRTLGAILDHGRIAGRDQCDASMSPAYSGGA